MSSTTNKAKPFFQVFSGSLSLIPSSGSNAAVFPVGDWSVATVFMQYQANTTGSALVLSSQESLPVGASGADVFFATTIENGASIVATGSNMLQTSVANSYKMFSQPAASSGSFNYKYSQNIAGAQKMVFLFHESGSFLSTLSGSLVANVALSK